MTLTSLAKTCAYAAWLNYSRDLNKLWVVKCEPTWRTPAVLNLEVLERSIDRTELYTCDELLLCGTGAQISPVIEVDRRPVGDGKVGEFTQELQNIYFGAVRGESPKYRDWTIPVY